MKKKKYSKDGASITQVNNENKLLKNKSFWGLIVIVIMISSVFAFSAFNTNNGDNSLEYKNYKFFNRGKGWETKLNGQDVSFLYNPKEVENIPVLGSNINSNEIYLVVDSQELSEYGYEVNRINSFLNLKGIRTYNACLNEQHCGDLPVVNCDKGNVLILRTGNKSSIYNEEGCIVIEGESSDYMKVVDRFIYEIYGII